MADGYANGAIGSVQVAPYPATTGETLTLQSGEGATMPTPPFNAVAKPKNQQPKFGNFEIVRVTAIDGDELTIERAAEDTTALGIQRGWDFYAGVTAKTLDDIYAAINDADAVDKHYEQPFANETAVTVNHSLNKFPSVTVITSAGDEITGDVEHVDANNLTVSFSAATGGVIYCN